MRKIDNGFMEYYYLTTDGTVYNKKTGKLLIGDSKGRIYILKTTSGNYKKITIKELYKLVYNKNFCIDNIENLEDEHWKPIERTNELYWVSDYGRVKSLKGLKAIILKPNYNRGYQQVKIIQDNSICNKLVSRLVAYAFLLPPKSLDCQIHHINEITTDNRAENLMWVTPQEHRAIHKRLEMERKQSQKGE